MRSDRAPVILVALVVVCAAIGYGAGPLLSRMDDTVSLAARIWREDSEGLEEWTLGSEAFRNTMEPAESLFARAGAVRRRYVWGGAILGAWMGLVIGVKLFGLSRVSQQDTYEVDQAACVACCRCFLSCPREHVRLKGLLGQMPVHKEAEAEPEREPSAQ
jgi:NosR/NirI family nitrous oxide reductase transcriptional regulator